MDTQTALLLVVVTLLVVGAIAWIYLRQRRSQELKSRFGPEYDHTLHERGDRSRAEAELRRRADRVEKLAIRPLPAPERSRYAERWEAEQAHFVDDPPAAVKEADHLVEEVMERRGYPVGDFDQRAADISVDHPRVVENYRVAHAIARQLENGRAATEDLRKAMIHYRALFLDLLEERPAQEAPSR